MSMATRLQHAWDAFRNIDQQKTMSYVTSSMSSKPKSVQSSSRANDLTVAIFEQISIDVAAIDIRHVRTDENHRFKEEIPSGLNDCLTYEANINQTGREFIQDIVYSMCDEGSIAVVPMTSDGYNPMSPSFDIKTLGVGKIIDWYPSAVRVRLFNPDLNQYQEVVVPKRVTAIINNPFYSVMNEKNSTLQRLKQKIRLLDDFDNDRNGTSKLDIIIQLPYSVRSKTREQQAKERLKSLEDQLSGAQYGIGYIDSTEHITQLNRPVENNLPKQIENLTRTLYSQLGVTQEVFEGTASDKVMLNYYNRTIEPVLSAIVNEFNRKFITKTARSQGQCIMYFRDPFKLVPVSELADIADKLTRNEIASSNEIRSIVGWAPSDDPKADELRNKNLNAQVAGDETMQQYNYQEEE